MIVDVNNVAGVTGHVHHPESGSNRPRPVCLMTKPLPTEANESLQSVDASEACKHTTSTSMQIQRRCGSRTRYWAISIGRSDSVVTVPRPRDHRRSHINLDPCGSEGLTVATADLRHPKGIT
jgi:hypothetical protein